MKTPHKHAEVIKAWADGAEIQFRYPNGTWIDAADPSFRDLAEYRVKPEPQILEGYVVTMGVASLLFIDTHRYPDARRATLTIHPDE